MPRRWLLEARADDAATWTSTDPILALGEPGVEVDTGAVKFGDGTTAWSALPYSDAAATAAIGALPEPDGNTLDVVTPGFVSRVALVAPTLVGILTGTTSPTVINSANVGTVGASDFVETWWGGLVGNTTGSPQIVTLTVARGAGVITLPTVSLPTGATYQLWLRTSGVGGPGGGDMLIGVDGAPLTGHVLDSASGAGSGSTWTLTATLGAAGLVMVNGGLIVQRTILQ